MENKKNLSVVVGEIVCLAGMLLFFYTIYLIIKDYLAVHNVFNNMLVTRPGYNIQEVFDTFEKVIIYSVTKLLPISLVLISAGALTAKHLLSAASRVVIVSFSAFIIVMAAYFVGGDFETVCAAESNRWFAWNECMATIMPVSLLAFTSSLILTKNDSTPANS